MRTQLHPARTDFVAARTGFWGWLTATFACSLLAVAQTQTRYQVIRHLDGMEPTALIEGKDGNLYGTLATAGRKAEGVVFRLSKDGSGYRVLHAFTRDGGGGVTPQGLVQAKDGTFYGTTENLGTNQRGTAFKLKPAGKGVTILHSFPVSPDDGSHPQGPMIQGRDGAFYGLTKSGGTQNSATVFQLILQSSP
jgi:uncharacterized repeat protein (TIGR03803 family)